MWIRWGEDVDVDIAGDDATIHRGDLRLLLPGAAAILTVLREKLSAPRQLQELEQELASCDLTIDSSHVLREMMNAQVLIPWKLTPELIRIHEQTVRGAQDSFLSSVHETRRIMRESGVVQGGSGCCSTVALPYPESTRTLLEEAMERRKTCRQFHPQYFGMEQLGSIVGLSAASRTDGDLQSAATGRPSGDRPYPSGGALYSVEIILYSLNISGLGPGFYYYQALSHQLLSCAKAQLAPALKRLLANHPIEGAAFLVLLFLDFTRVSLSKYGGKAYRLALIEAGHLAQNLLLSAAAHGLAGLPLCGFDDEALSRAAGLRYPEEPVVYALAVGSPAGECKYE